MERLKRIVFLCFTILSLLPGLAHTAMNEDNTVNNSVNWEPVMDAIIQVESGGNFAFVYVAGSIYWDKMRLWYGAFYGILITIIMHGFLIPLFGFRYPKYAGGLNGWLWNLDAAELWSEFLGHIYWSVSIEICMIAVLAHFGRPIYGQWWKD